MKKYFVLYDITNSESGNAILNEFRKFEDSRRVFDAVWVVTTNKTARDIVDAISDHCKSGEVVVVSQIEDEADFASGGGDMTFKSWLARIDRLEK